LSEASGTVVRGHFREFRGGVAGRRGPVSGAGIRIVGRLARGPLRWSSSSTSTGACASSIRPVSCGDLPERGCRSQLAMIRAATERPGDGIPAQRVAGGVDAAGPEAD